jgi:hypothetical protein
MIKKIGDTQKNDVVTRFWYTLKNLDPFKKYHSSWAFQ